MSADRRPQFNQHSVYDKTPLPFDIPRVREIGATSAPLLSASFFIGARCRPFGDDYMQCKKEAQGRGEAVCLNEGRKVTRCARSVLDDINKHCLEEFRRHWNCLENKNQQLHQCRDQEWVLSKCVFDKLNLVKVVPDQPPNVTPVHLRQKQIFADRKWAEGKPFVPPEGAQVKATS
jgi:NADH dehydrogenase (ubiquinone) 1 alpha subcomplex subunit 8